MFNLGGFLMSTAREQAIAAVRAGGLEDLKRLIGTDRSVAAVRDDNGVSILLLACYHRRAEIVQELLAAEPPTDIFDASALPGLDARGKQLLDSDPALAMAWSADGFTALHLASYFNRPA